MKQVLTHTEQSLLQRYYDGDELPEREASEVESLLNKSQAARIFMTALEELTVAAQVAEEYAWDRADAPPGKSVAEAAFEAASLADAPLADLAPLLERFFDGEVVVEEMVAVQALIDEREDVADYLTNLEGLRTGVQTTSEHLVEGVSFDNFWDSLETRLDLEDATFDPEEHRVLLYRYHDGEATAAECAQVDGWLEAGEPEVAETLAVLGELNLAAVAGVEMAQERADLSGLWHGIENELDDQIESQGENVVSFERQKRERKGFLSDSRQGVFVAVAAMLLVAFGAGLFGDQLLGTQEKVIVEKTVVIVDSVEYQPGSSVMVNSPMKPVSAVTDVEGESVGAAEEEEEPTVIWLLDTSEDAAPADEGADEQEPSKDEQPAEEITEQPI